MVFIVKQCLTMKFKCWIELYHCFELLFNCIGQCWNDPPYCLLIIRSYSWIMLKELWDLPLETLFHWPFSINEGKLSFLRIAFNDNAKAESFVADLSWIAFRQVPKKDMNKMFICAPRSFLLVFMYLLSLALSSSSL